MPRVKKEDRFNPYSNVKYSKHWIRDSKIKYKVLAVSQISDKDKAAIRSTIKTIVTGDEASQFASQMAVENAMNPSARWSYTVLDMRGEVGLLQRNGFGVALFYRRQIIEMIPGPGEPIPEGELKDPADTWVRVDLLGGSARQQNLFSKVREENITGENELLKESAAAKQVQIDDLETRMLKLNEQLDNNKKLHDRLKEYISVLSKHIGLRKAKELITAAAAVKESQRKKKLRKDAKFKKITDAMKAKERKDREKLDRKMAKLRKPKRKKRVAVKPVKKKAKNKAKKKGRK